MAAIKQATEPDFPLACLICLDEFTPFGYDLEYGLRMAAALEAERIVRLLRLRRWLVFQLRPGPADPARRRRACRLRTSATALKRATLSCLSLHSAGARLCSRPNGGCAREA